MGHRRVRHPEGPWDFLWPSCPDITLQSLALCPLHGSWVALPLASDEVWHSFYKWGNWGPGREGNRLWSIVTANQLNRDEQSSQILPLSPIRAVSAKGEPITAQNALCGLTAIHQLNPVTRSEMGQIWPTAFISLIATTIFYNKSKIESIPSRICWEFAISLTKHSSPEHSTRCRTLHVFWQNWESHQEDISRRLGEKNPKVSHPWIFS